MVKFFYLMITFIFFSSIACSEKDPAFVDATNTTKNKNDADVVQCLTEPCAIIDNEHTQGSNDNSSEDEEVNEVDSESGDGDDLSSRSDTSDEENDGDSDSNPIKNINDLMLACGDLKEAENFTTVTKTVTFASTKGQECEFGEYGNLSEKDQYFRAIRTQNAGFDVEPDKIVCNITFDFLKYSEQQKSMRYDDLMFLTVRGTNVEKEFDTGNLLIASTENLNKHFENLDDTDLFVFDWADLKDQRFDGNSKGYRYCYGTDSFRNCKVPGHDTVGDLEIKIADTEALYLANELIPAKNLEFGFTITGDDNSTDCQHDKDFSFDVTIYYAK